jgi:hypothetical protein
MLDDAGVARALQTIDLMDNQLDGDLLPTLERIPSLLSIALNGNAATRAPSFRKRLIASLPKLCYLDRPVEEQERLGAVAFMEGGAEAERAARDATSAAKAAGPGWRARALAVIRDARA